MSSFFHFNAAAGNPKVAGALQTQTKDTLQSFDNYLRQAIDTAKKRQTRYQLPWEKVQHDTQQILTITPRDTVVLIPRPPLGTLLIGWPNDTLADLTQTGFIINRGTPFTVTSTTRTEHGLRVVTNIPLIETDQIAWCGITNCTVQQEQNHQPPANISTLDGALLTLHHCELDASEQNWRAVIKEKLDPKTLIVDGQETNVTTISPFENLRNLADDNNTLFHGTKESFTVEERPCEGPLRGNNYVQFDWKSSAPEQRKGCWVQLLPPEEQNTDDFIDPRAAFCEGDVREIWTQPRHHNNTTIKVKRVDQDRYQLLLERYPAQDDSLFLPLDTRNLYLQRRALRQLMNEPLPHHQGLLRLCEDPTKVRWPNITPVHIADDAWFELKDLNRSGTDQQRTFVKKALATKDIAILEGPPGSGKTTAICELVQQLVRQGQRILMCASTHVAIDNVLERLLTANAPIDALRIGHVDRIDETVQTVQFEHRVESLVAQWRNTPAFHARSEADLTEMATRTVIMAANLTCGTTMGIANHPLFRDNQSDRHVYEQLISTMPHWDVLIIDEASKTLIQEFMVPALMSKRWIIVGDVRQLPPFTDRADMVANLRDLRDQNDNPRFTSDHQRACLIRFQLSRRELQNLNLKWLIVEPNSVLDHLVNELNSRTGQKQAIVHITRRGQPDQNGLIRTTTLESLREDHLERLHLAAADWLLVSTDLLPEVSDLLPANIISSSILNQTPNPILPENNVFFMRQQSWFKNAGQLPHSYRNPSSRAGDIKTVEQCQESEAKWLTQNDLADQIAWRITRRFELRRSHNQDERNGLKKTISELLPHATNVQDAIEEIEDIGLPSILEVLQEGIGQQRSKRRSALTEGLGSKDSHIHFDARFESLSYQHRMHPDIAAFPREHIYDGKSLKDANTIQFRDQKVSWDFGNFSARRVWHQVNGREFSNQNLDEVAAMKKHLEAFIEWAKRKGPPNRGPNAVWEVACLTFYVKQEQAISDMLRKLTGDNRRTRFSIQNAPVEIVCGTVDRFQGREADLVLLSMRNTRRVGFLDSLNRLNVALTRARQQVIIVGNADYFKSCKVEELKSLAKTTISI